MLKIYKYMKDRIMRFNEVVIMCNRYQTSEFYVWIPYLLRLFFAAFINFINYLIFQAYSNTEYIKQSVICAAWTEDKNVFSRKQ